MVNKFFIFYILDDCDAGYYCASGANISMPTDGTTGDICPIGNYCPTGSQAPLPCPEGTYMNETGAPICNGCPPRFYCVNGDVADPCPLGAYCPGNNGYDYSLCPPGTLNAVTMLSNESECQPCTGGSYCATPGLNTTTDLCAAGYFCTSGVDTATPNNNNNTGTGGMYCPASQEWQWCHV